MSFVAKGKLYTQPRVKSNNSEYIYYSEELWYNDLIITSNDTLEVRNVGNPYYKLKDY